MVQMVYTGEQYYFYLVTSDDMKSDIFLPVVQNNVCLKVMMY